MTTQNRAWDRAKELLAACLPHLPVSESMQVGPFLYRGVYSAEDNHFTFERSAGIRSVVKFYVGGAWRSDQFSELAIRVVTDGGEEWRLMSHTIAHDIGGETFPKLSIRWSGEAVPGELRLVRIFSGPHTYVNYYPRQGSREVVRRGDENLPDDLNEALDQLGVEVQRQIDYEARALDILLQSELQAFSDAARQLPRL